MNILSGVFAPDAGEMLLEGQPVRFDELRAAQAAGVATIFQELDLVPSLDVTANLFLGRELTRGGVLDRPAMRKEALTRISVVGADIGVDQPVGELSVGRRQIVAIAKALTYVSKILIMDEPTAALTASEVERLFVVMREIAARGVGIVYISHRLEEVPRVADRVTVMRDGQVAGVQPAKAPQSELVGSSSGAPSTSLSEARDRVRQARPHARARPLHAPDGAARLAGASGREPHRARGRDRRPRRDHGGRAHRAPDRALWRGGKRQMVRRRSDRRRARALNLDPRRARRGARPRNRRPARQRTPHPRHRRPQLGPDRPRARLSRLPHVARPRERARA